MKPMGSITPEVFDKMKAGLSPSPARAQFNSDKQRDIDESVGFWESALEYVKSDEYTPETYNIKFGDTPFAWCRRMELIDSTCDECELFEGEWCGHAPFINKTQPETSNCMLEDTPLDKVEFGVMPQDELSNNIEAFIKVLKSLVD
jgi:hypothetical protein